MKKTIIITGSSSGIGLVLATYLGKKGHRIYGFSRKKTESEYFNSISVDITDEAQVKQAVLEVLKKEKTIDILINNAGMGMVGPVEDTKKIDIQTLFNLNLVGSVHLMSAVLASMREQKKGKILNISSIGSEMGLPFRGFYSASKAALDKITEAIRYEVSPWDIQIAALHLGDIKTNIADHRLQTEVSEVYKTRFNQVYQLMNAHVNEGSEVMDVAIYIDALLAKNKWKAHYYFGKFGQKIGVSLKKFLPQNLFEALMKSYNKMK